MQKYNFIGIRSRSDTGSYVHIDAYNSILEAYKLTEHKYIAELTHLRDSFKELDARTEAGFDLLESLQETNRTLLAESAVLKDKLVELRLSLNEK